METLPPRELPERAAFDRFDGGTATLESATKANITPGDLERITEICNQPRVRIWVTEHYATGRDGSYTLEDAKKFINMADDGWARKQAFVYLIRDEEERIMGAIDIKSADKSGTEIGYWADTSRDQGGYMTNALNLLCDIAARAGYESLSAYVMPRNAASIGVLTRAGFENKGLTYRRTESNDIGVLEYCKVLVDENNGD
ncbi:MAG: GNAT family N-acetyltransferase [Candidatus Saccharimonadales bacterium]